LKEQEKEWEKIIARREIEDKEMMPEDFELKEVGYDLEKNLNSELNEAERAVQQEVRSRYIMALKGAFWEKFSKNQCKATTILVLNEAAAWDGDNTDKPLESWKII